MGQVLLINIATANLSFKPDSEKAFILPESFLPVRVEQRIQNGGPLIQLELEKPFLFTFDYSQRKACCEWAVGDQLKEN